MSKQLIKGNNNIQAGRDVNITSGSFLLNFNYEHLKDIIDKISTIHSDEYLEKTDFSRPSLDEKNKKNNLSDEYFEYINMEFLPYFKQIDLFLRDPINKESKEKYLKSTKAINFYIKSQKSIINISGFEIVFTHIMDTLDKKYIDDSELFRVLVHYMYWNCDIGDK